MFGKSQENMRNRIRVEMVTQRARALKLVSKPMYKNTRRIRGDLCVITSGIKTLKLCKPIIVGFSILELSKWKMYEFHYEKMLKWYPSARMLFTDTDSFLYEVETQNLYTDLKRSDTN